MLHLCQPTVIQIDRHKYNKVCCYLNTVIIQRVQSVKGHELKKMAIGVMNSQIKNSGMYIIIEKLCNHFLTCVLFVKN